MMSDARGQSIVLIGLRGSGKSTVGRLLADRLGLPHLDVDELIQAEANRTISQIFEEQGEHCFRALEAQAIARLAPQLPAVVSAGGGAVCREDNRAYLAQFGYVIWLTAAPETLCRRILADRRSPSARPPLGTEDTLGELRRTLAARAPHYGSLARWQLDTTQCTPTEATEAILDHVRP